MPLYTYIENVFCGGVQFRGELENDATNKPLDLSRQAEAAIPPWLLACAMCEETGGEGVLKCGICNKLDIFTQDMLRTEELPTQVKSWVAPCACRTVVCHRRCLEKNLPRHWVNLDDGRTTVVQVASVGKCDKCGKEYRAGYRLCLGVDEVFYVSGLGLGFRL